MLASMRAARDPAYQPRPKRLTRDEKDIASARIGRTTRIAIAGMAWEGLSRADAAKRAGITEHTLYVALRKPAARALYLQELEVLRLSGRAHRLHRLEAIGDQDTNLNAAVNAIKLLDYQEDSHSSMHDRGATAGFVIQVIAAPGTTIAGKTIDAELMHSHPKADNVDIIE